MSVCSSKPAAEVDVQEMEETERELQIRKPMGMNKVTCLDVSNIPHKDFSKYLQIRHFKRSLLRTAGICMRCQIWKTLVLTKSPKGLISKIYT